MANTTSMLDKIVLGSSKEAAIPAAEAASPKKAVVKASEADLGNIITGPEVAYGDSLKPEDSLARDLIIKYVPGKDPEKDKLENSSEWKFGPQFSSRDWSNRKAKEAAETIITDPNADYQTMTTSNIWKQVLRAEGGYSNDPNDRGGETKYGISKRSYPEEDIVNLTPQRAQEIFEKDFYAAVGGDSLLKINPGLAAHVSDMAFNAGPKAAVKLLYDAVQLPRQSQITPDLLDKLNNSDSLIKDYSVARLKYYAGLDNAPTYIKGWANRVNNLNKALKVNSGLGGAYKSAKNLDVEALVHQVYSTQEQLAPRFRALDQVEVERLQRANEMLAPGYRRPAEESASKLSSIGEVFKATYDAKYFTNTVDGMNELAVRAAADASNINRKAMGTKFQKSVLESATGGLYGGINSLEDFEEEVKELKKANPDVKLPFEDSSKVYEMMHTRAKEIEDAYNKLDSGSFGEGVGESFRKLGHVLAGYLPGEILGSLSDRAEGALNLIPLPGATTAANVAKGAVGVMLGTGAIQAVVQPGRQELGLQGGAAEGALNAVGAGVGQAILGGAAGLGTKLFRSGSKETGEALMSQADKMTSILKAQEATPTTLHAAKAVSDLKAHAKDYFDNPYGDTFEAKQIFEANQAAAMDDLLNDRPVREMTSEILKTSDTSQELAAQMRQMGGEDSIGYAGPEIDDGVKLWSDMKNAAVVDARDFQSTVPLETPEGGLYQFSTKEEAIAFAKGKPNLIAMPEPSGEGFYIARAADLEFAEHASSRMQEGAKEITLGDKKVYGFEGSEDLALAEKYPDRVTSREIQTAQAPKAQYADLDATEPHRAYVAETDKIPIETRLKTLDDRMSAYLTEVTKNNPDRVFDVGEDAESFITAKQVFEELGEERSVLDGMFSCMSPGPTK